jgi:type IV secretory pathway VirB9-like protein
MKKSSKPEKAQDDGERRRKLQFKRKKQRNQEPRVNLKNVKSLQDLDEYDDYQF